jgi:hypothetical protein
MGEGTESCHCVDGSPVSAEQMRAADARAKIPALSLQSR